MSESLRTPEAGEVWGRYGGRGASTLWPVPPFIVDAFCAPEQRVSGISPKLTRKKWFNGRGWYLVELVPGQAWVSPGGSVFRPGSDHPSSVDLAVQGLTAAQLIAAGWRLESGPKNRRDVELRSLAKPITLMHPPSAFQAVNERMVKNIEAQQDRIFIEMTAAGHHNHHISASRDPACPACSVKQGPLPDVPKEPTLDEYYALVVSKSPDKWCGLTLGDIGESARAALSDEKRAYYINQLEELCRRDGISLPVRPTGRSLYKTADHMTYGDLTDKDRTLLEKTASRNYIRELQRCLRRLS